MPASADDQLQRFTETLSSEIKSKRAVVAGRGSRKETKETTAGALLDQKVKDAPLPEFLPLFSVPFPETINGLRQNYRQFTDLGVFAEISRIWMIVDNKLILWNFWTQGDVVVHCDGEDVILNVALVKPMRTVFQFYVSFLLVIVTKKSLSLYGIAFDQAACSTDYCKQTFQIIHLGYTIGTPEIITHVRGDPDTRRLFASGIDGRLYEVEYYKHKGMFQGNMKLTDASLYFRMPLLDSINSKVNSLKEGWFGQKSACRDLILDSANKKVVLLLDKDILEFWSYSDSSTRAPTRVARVAHQAALLDAQLQPDQPLFQLFPPDDGDNRVVFHAISRSGRRYSYECNSVGYLGSNQLTIVGCHAPIVNSEAEVQVALRGPGFFLHTLSKEKEEDKVVLVSTPQVMLPPNENTLEVFSVLTPTSNDKSVVTRIDAMAQLLTDYDASELRNQVTCPPTTFVLVSRLGVFLYLKVRPVDTLHLICEAADDCRQSLLQRFSTAYGSQEFATMLVQLACGNKGDLSAFDGLRNIASMRGQVFLPQSEPNSHGFLESLGKQMISPVKQSTVRFATDLLRSLSGMSLDQRKDGGRVTVVPLSPFTCGLSLYVSRILRYIWERKVFVAGESSSKLRLSDDDDFWAVIPLVDKLLVEVQRLMDRFRDDLWQDIVLPAETVIASDLFKFEVASANVSARDAARVQGTRWATIYRVVERTAQAMIFLGHLKSMQALIVETALAAAFGSEECSFQDLLATDKGVKLARTLSSSLIAAERNVAVPQFQHLLQTFAVMEQQCGYLVSPLDGLTLRTRLELTAMGRGNSLAAANFQERRRTIQQHAGALWKAGALQSICTQLVSLNQGVFAVQALLHAAAQLEAPQTSAEDFFNASRSQAHSWGTSGTEGRLQLTLSGKRSVIELASQMLLSLWSSHKETFDQLLGIPFEAFGCIWSTEPTDLMTHCLLFEWLRGEGFDESMQLHFRGLLVSANSQALETYLRFSRGLEKEYALYLHRRKKDIAAAQNLYLKLALEDLDLPQQRKLPFRVQCLNEAVRCASEGNPTEFRNLMGRLDELELQCELATIVERLLKSGADYLNNTVKFNDRELKQATLAEHHLSSLQNNVYHGKELYDLALSYRLNGGAEVAVKLTLLHGVHDHTLFADLLELIYDNPSPMLAGAPRSVELAQSILARFYSPVLFPLDFAIRLFETDVYQRTPYGSDSVPILLADRGIEFSVSFACYKRVIDQPEQLIDCPTYTSAGVTTEYMLYSAVSLLHREVARKAGRGTSTAVRSAYSEIATLVDKRERITVGLPEQQDRQKALTSARQLLLQCNHIANLI